MSTIEPWQPNRVANLGRQGRAIINQVGHRVLAEQGEALVSATVVRGNALLGDELMTGLDQLRRHEARAAAEDPLVAEEYAMIRKAVLHAGLDEIARYGRRP